MNLADYVAACVRAPAEDAPRLALADALDARAGPAGPARAALIRDQVELARMARTVDPACDTPRQHYLRQGPASPAGWTPAPCVRCWGRARGDLAARAGARAQAHTLGIGGAEPLIGGTPEQNRDVRAALAAGRTFRVEWARGFPALLECDLWTLVAVYPLLMWHPDEARPCPVTAVPAPWVRLTDPVRVDSDYWEGDADEFDAVRFWPVTDAAPPVAFPALVAAGAELGLSDLPGDLVGGRGPVHVRLVDVVGRLPARAFPGATGAELGLSDLPGDLVGDAWTAEVTRRLLARAFPGAAGVEIPRR